ncbi:TetR/AcrR family transcriptional regulator [Nocardia sp. IFM 10818]
MSDRQTRILEAAVHVIAQDGVRGLRIEKVAAAAGVSTALIYYHFKDRRGVVLAALAHIDHRAACYTDRTCADADARSQVEEVLLLELQETEEVRENSIAWGELRASAVFNTDLREPLRVSTQSWTDYIESLIRQAQEEQSVPAGVHAADAAERLTALVEGLSERWLSGSITLDRARRLLSGAVAAELG